jgi:iron only hydrogenase large subunit-like protein
MEGMACQGGCTGGPANLNKPQVTKKLVEIFAKKSEHKKADQNEKTA